MTPFTRLVASTLAIQVILERSYRGSINAQASDCLYKTSAMTPFTRLVASTLAIQVILERSYRGSINA
ncbi:hypothetical protein AB4266_18465, partial [Vibrio breoganii]